MTYWPNQLETKSEKKQKKDKKKIKTIKRAYKATIRPLIGTLISTIKVFHIPKLVIFVKILYAYLAFVGIFGFALFIAEESSQICMWGNFAAQDAKRYDLVKMNLEQIERTNKVFKKVNDYFMWVNPFQFWAYGAWSDSTERYNASLQGLILAKEPTLYVGEMIDIQFRWDKYSHAKNGYYVATNGKVKVVLKTEPREKTIHVKGTVVIDPQLEKGIIITAE